MPQLSLEEQLEAARFADSPFDALYAVATSLRDVGLSQLDLYREFSKLYHKHQDDEDQTFYGTIADVLDCIWCGGWGKDHELFDVPLTSLPDETDPGGSHEVTAARVPRPVDG